MRLNAFCARALFWCAQAAMVSVAYGAPAAAPPPPAQTVTVALVLGDATPLRAAPRDSAQQQALLWPGEVVELRGERMDYLQVWDHRRERGGFVRASQLLAIGGPGGDAAALLAQLRLVQGTVGSEALGIGLAAAYIQAATPQALQGSAGLEVFDALGSMADRLARRASAGQAHSRSAQDSLAAHLDVAARHGLAFTSHEYGGRMQVCYEGDMFRRVLAMAPALPRPALGVADAGERPAQDAAARALAERQARAALALTRPECIPPQLRLTERQQRDEWRAELLDRVDARALPVYLKNRLHMRRATVHSSLAFQRARKGEPAEGPARRALAELAGVSPADLPDEDQGAYNDAVMRTNASRWAAVPAAGAPAPARQARIATVAGKPGETCVLLLDASHDEANPLARRCTFSVVWPQSASINREGTAVALAVQPMDGWRELWLFQKNSRESGGGWRIDVLPPSSHAPELGYAEFAGWVPGGSQVLVAREARAGQDGGGRYRRSYELTRLADLAVERQASDPALLGAFQRWQDPRWKRESVSLR